MSDFVGSGWAFPLATDDRGGIAMTSHGEELDAALRMILSTAPGERVMRPTFGCAIWDLLFAPLNAQTLGLLEAAVREAITQWEPRVDVDKVTAAPGAEQGRVEIRLVYRVKASNDRRNLVYPFYIVPAGQAD